MRALKIAAALPLLAALSISPIASCRSALAADLFLKEVGDHNVLIVSGEIVSGDFNKFVELVRDARSWKKPVNEIRLSSPGGLVGEAANIAIYARGATKASTVVSTNSICASACFMIWASGRVRSVEPNARIGNHSVYENGLVPNLDANQVEKQILLSMGVDDTLAGRMVDTLPQSMFWLNEAEIGGLHLAKPSPIKPLILPEVAKVLTEDMVANFNQDYAIEPPGAVATPLQSIANRPLQIEQATIPPPAAAPMPIVIPAPPSAPAIAPETPTAQAPQADAPKPDEAHSPFSNLFSNWGDPVRPNPAPEDLPRGTIHAQCRIGALKSPNPYDGPCIIEKAADGSMRFRSSADDRSKLYLLPTADGHMIYGDGRVFLSKLIFTRTEDHACWEGFMTICAWRRPHPEQPKTLVDGINDLFGGLFNSAKRTEHALGLTSEAPAE